MKKSILCALAILLMSFLCFTPFVFAQQETQWVKRIIPADELKGEKGGVSYVYEDSNGSFTFRDNTTIVEFCTYTLSTFNYGLKKLPKGSLPYKPFYESGSDAYYRCVDGIVGYYVNGSLNKKENVSFYTGADSDYKHASPNEEVSRRILNHIKNKGSIRIIIPLYGGSDFDITVPRYK